jgi:hypothetical protein
MVKRAWGPIVATLCLILLSHNVWAQASDHERVGVERKDILEVTPGLSVDLASTQANTAQALGLYPTLSLDTLYRRSLSLSVAMPLYSWFALDRDSAQRYAYATGDPYASLGYSGRVGDWRLGAGVSYQHPLGIWNTYEVKEVGISSSSGYPTLGLRLSAIRYLDPIVASVALKAQTGLARSERYGWSSRPLVLTVDTSAMDALSSKAALSLGLENVYALPRLENGIPSSSGSSYSLSGSLSLVLSDGDNSLYIGASKPLTDYSSSATLMVRYSYTFRIKETAK